MNPPSLSSLLAEIRAFYAGHDPHAHISEVYILTHGPFVPYLAPILGARTWSENVPGRPHLWTRSHTLLSELKPHLSSFPKE